MLVNCAVLCVSRGASKELKVLKNKTPDERYTVTMATHSEMSLKMMCNQARLFFFIPFTSVFSQANKEIKLSKHNMLSVFICVQGQFVENTDIKDAHTSKF